jgi:hypothetical protein
MDPHGSCSNCQSTCGLVEWILAVLMRFALRITIGYLTSFACTLAKLPIADFSIFK